MANDFVSIPVPVGRVQEVYDLLARKPTSAVAARAEPHEDSIIWRAYMRTSDTMRRFFDFLAEHPGELVGAGQMERHLGLTEPQFRGHLGGFTKLWTGPLGQPPDSHWFFDAWGSGEGGTMEYRATDDVAAEIFRAKEAYDRRRKR